MYEIELSHNTGLTTSDCATALIADVKPTNKALLWHNRLNHCSKSVLKRFNKCNGSNLFTKKEFKEFSLVLCSGCALGKMTLAPVPRYSSTTEKSLQEPLKPGQLVVMDLSVSPVQSIGGSNFALVIMDVATRYAWSYFIPTKDAAAGKIDEWLLDVKKKGITPAFFTTIRTDNGGEFVSKEFTAACLKAGLTRERSPPYAHVYDVERVIRTIQDDARSLLQASSTSKGFWADAMAHATYVYNRLPNKSSKLSKYQLMYGVAPDPFTLRTFGSIVYAKEYDELRKKWDPKAFRGRFLGYDSLSPKSYRVWKPACHLVVNTSNVVFDEQVQSFDSTVPKTVSELDSFFISPVGDLTPISLLETSDSPLLPTLREQHELSTVTGIATRTRAKIQTFTDNSESALIADQASLSTAQRNIPNSSKQAKASPDAVQW
jgi:hypothetical protein